MKIKGTTVNWQLVAMTLLFSTLWPYCQEGTPVECSWEGLFMETFQLTLDFRQDAGGAGTGSVLLSQNGQQLQNDPLSNIRLEGWNTTTKPDLLNKELEYYYAFLNPEPVFEFSYRAPNDDAVQSRTLRATDRATVKTRGMPKCRITSTGRMCPFISTIMQ